jgi:hypothetical protein
MVPRTLAEIHNHLCIEINRANLYHQDNANNCQLPSLNYQNGDVIWVNRYNGTTYRPSKKLDNKQHGPFKILENISPYSYQIALPPWMKCHNVFKVSLLEPTTDDTPITTATQNTCPWSKLMVKMNTVSRPYLSPEFIDKDYST